MNYEETLQYLYHKLPLYSHIGLKAYKADLVNTVDLCQFLGNPQTAIKTVHVAGTNGKGSTSHMLAAVFQQNGFRTGLYTSPHLKDFRERIKIDGAMISKEFVCRFVEKIQLKSEAIHPSFFELTFAMALDYFFQQQVDIAIIETGLGGRLDSTNVIEPEIAVITNIGMDHMDILGDTLEKIAGEKAGIIKPGIPVVIGAAGPETKPVFLAKALQENSPILFGEDRYTLLASQISGDRLAVTLGGPGAPAGITYQLDLTGLYQAKNLVTVLTTIDLLRHRFLLSEEKTFEALSHVRLLTGFHGRWEVIGHRPLIVLDVAHNIDGIGQVVRQLEHTVFQRLHIVFGMVRDKEIDRVLEALPAGATYYFTKAQIPRALPADQLRDRAQAFNLAGDAYDEVNKALDAARSNATEEDMILVCGSVFVVGEVRVDA